MEFLTNMADAQSKGSLITALQRLVKGVYKVTVVQHRDRRSAQQNKYLWGCVYPAVAEGIYEAWGERLTAEEVHEFLKIHFLRKPIVDRNTGERKGYTVPSTPKLDTKEFGEYLEKIMAFAAESLGVVVPEASFAREPARN